MIDWGTIASAGASLGSALGGYLTRPKQADTSQGTAALWNANANTSSAVQRAMAAYQNAYQSARGDINLARDDITKYLTPYVQEGGKGLYALSNALTPTGGTSSIDMVSGLPTGAGADLMGFLTQTPFYQQTFNEGQRGVENSLLARGMGLSGQAGKALTQYGQNFAAQNALAPAMANYQNYLKNISGLAGMGYTASNSLGQRLADLGVNLANVDMQTGQNYGSANMTGAQLQNALAGNIASSYQTQGLLNQAYNNQQGNALGSLLGTGFGAARDIYNAGPWSQIGSGGTVPFNQGGANALNAYRNIWGQ